MYPFSIYISPSVFRDLRNRIQATRWPTEPSDAHWQYGISLAYLRDLTTHWVTGFDWDSVQQNVNQHVHYMVPFGETGSGNNSIHVEQIGMRTSLSTPLLMLAGWPSCFLEYRHVAEALAASGRTVYVIDLPGFGLSDPPDRPLDPRQMARLIRDMMVDQFGHRSFIAQGGDWGSVVASWLGVDHPDVVAAIHISSLGLKPPSGPDTEPLSDAERAWLRETSKRLQRDSGYREIQATKPTTLAVGLVDSPVALAAWVAEKYVEWTGGADREDILSHDEILGPISLYWVTGSLVTANWIYWADRHASSIATTSEEHCSVPTGLSFFEQGFFPSPPDSWVRRAYNLVYRKNFSKGGHFPAWTQPRKFVSSLQEFLDQLGL